MLNEGASPGGPVTRGLDNGPFARREEIFRAMVVVADRRRRGRRVKRAGAAALFAAAAVALTAGVLGTLPTATPPSAGGGAVAEGGSSNGLAAPPSHRPAGMDQRVAVRVDAPAGPASPAAAAAVRGVERLEGSSLRRAVVAQVLTDEAFERALATQGEVGTVQVRGRVLVLSNSAAEGPRSVR
jgi:hypothetical protein